jgi:hypothetical protein
MSEERRKGTGDNQGEGDRESARRYNDHLREFVVYGDPRRAARDARDALEGPEAPGLRAAEQRGKAPAHMTRLEQVKGLALRLRHTLSALVSELRHRISARVAGHS